MGIDKENIRNILHHGAPKSMHDTIGSEFGRAGCDGDPANAILFYSLMDTSHMLMLGLKTT